MPRLALLTNMIPPYHKPVLDVLSRRYPNMRVLLSTPMESNRPWKLDWAGLDVVVQKTITLKGRWSHPRGFSEPLAVHLPIDTLQQLRRFRPDVVISWEMGFRTMLAMFYRKLWPASKMLVWAEVAESTEQGRGWARNLFRGILHRSVDAFIVVGESGARYIRSLGVSDTKIFKISYTTDINRFTAIPLTRHEEHAKRLLYVGQLVERKGLAPFLDVLSEWASANRDFQVEFLFAGDGPLNTALRRTSVPPNVTLTFLGSFQYDDLPKVYTQASILVLPTLADTWGVVVNEGMAAGLPILGSIYSQAVVEMVTEGQNGWTFRADKPDEIRAAIDRCLKTPPDKLNDMRKCARETAGRLTPEYVASLIQGAITACVNGSR
ncbi:MAG: glycosyltransferase family 4 protein [Bryobacteraceae bacterium]